MGYIINDYRIKCTVAFGKETKSLTSYTRGKFSVNNISALTVTQQEAE